MASSIPIPPELPQTAAATTPDAPWPLGLLSAKIEEYIGRMSHLWVKGEVIEYSIRPHTRTQYLTIKDIDEDISIQLSIYTHLLPASLDRGQQVVAYVKPSFYKARGRLNLWAQEIRPLGIGDILARIEALKNRLAAEGLFDAARKKPLPFIPRRIGLIGGRNAEGTRDVLVNTEHRFPGVQFEVREVAVQGVNAVVEIIPALAELDAIEDVDVIVIARGGGSLEDLLPFSDEQLVRAVAATATPVVSAIGHERDTPLLDFVADVRASTPTDAAKRIVPDVAEELAGIENLSQRVAAAAHRRIDQLEQELGALRSRPALACPQSIVDTREENLLQVQKLLHTHMSHMLDQNEANVARSLASLRTLSPLSTLERGYSILMDSSGVIVSRQSQAVVGDSLEAVLVDGRLELAVTSTIQGNDHAR